jgi:ABC-type dipeptide/oligopeptide/nickel transport system ATPase subunit
MVTPARSFPVSQAVRERVPLLVGLMGPSGSGKTYSALRLATGIQTVTGGDIFVIDTESRRALHYADNFKFKHLQFDKPFGSMDYLHAITQCVSDGAKVIVIDSMSHEHSGPGGYLLTQDDEVERMAGNDWSKRDRVKFAAWIKPAKLRQAMITGILQLNANFIFCFRAKEKIKPVPGANPVEMGFMPIAGEELLFEQTVNCLLLPKSNGIPVWRSDHVGEKLMMKLPGHFEKIFTPERQLSEDVGKELAAWAQGGADSSSPQAVLPAVANPAGPGVLGEASASGPDVGPPDKQLLDEIDLALAAAAELGMVELRKEWMSVHPRYQVALRERMNTVYAVTAKSKRAS